MKISESQLTLIARAVLRSRCDEQSLPDHRQGRCGNRVRPAIGAATVVALAEAGADGVITSRTEEDLTKVAAPFMQETGGGAIAHMATILSLASLANSQVTGEIIEVDGGVNFRPSAFGRRTCRTPHGTTGRPNGGARSAFSQDVPGRLRRISGDITVLRPATESACSRAAGAAHSAAAFSGGVRNSSICDGEAHPGRRTAVPAPPATWREGCAGRPRSRRRRPRPSGSRGRAQLKVPGRLCSA